MMSLPSFSWLTDSLKKRALRYLLQRYLGHFLLEKVRLEDLSVDLSNGTGGIQNLALDVDGLNEELLFLPFRFADGCHINEIKCSVPWSELLREPCSLEIDGASLFCEVTGARSPTAEPGIHESSYLSRSMMSSSMQMAEEIVQSEPAENRFDGLETMAELIDSVLRRVKLTAKNTSLIIQAPARATSTTAGTPSANQKPTQVEFRIKFLRCEEDLMGIESEEQKRINFNTPGHIDKLLTFEGVEVLIDQRCVCKLGGKHMIKIKANETKSDLQLFVGSPLMAIITSGELKRFIDVFCPPEPTDLPQRHSGAHQMHPNQRTPGAEKMMSSTDFKRIHELIQIDAANQNSHQPGRNPMAGGARWAGEGSFSSDADFLPIHEPVDSAQIETGPSNQFSFFIKIPGVWLCLLDRNEDPPEVSVPFVNSSFKSINEHLNKLLEQRSHLRVLALPIQMEITFSNIMVIAGDAMILEQTAAGLTPITWSEDHTELTNAPKYRCNIRKEDIQVEISTTTCLWLDPTFFERIDNYITPPEPRLNSASTTGSNLRLQVQSKHIKANLFFPVPDLRSEEQRVEDEGMDALINPGSQLRPDSLLFDIEGFNLSTTFTLTEMTCDTIKVTLNEPDQMPVQIIDARRNAVDLIELTIHAGPATATASLDSELERDAFFETAAMEDSIYISNASHQSVPEAFQIKRKLIKERSNDSESVIAPSDRRAAAEFLNMARGCTQLSVTIALPSIDVTLDKHRLELVYNRFGNDLVLWKPRRRSSSTTNSKSDLTQTRNTIYPFKPTQTNFSLCKSGIMSDSMDSESSFHSVDGNGSSKFLNVAAIEVTAQEVNFRAELATGPVQCVSGQNVLVGVVVGLESDTVNTIFICGDKAALQQDADQIITSNTYTDSISQLNMTFEIRMESRELKKLKIALQVCDAALHTLDIDIFRHFWEVINITDEAVLGYQPPTVQTELHISLMNGAIALESPDQLVRPALFTFDDVYATSMVVADTTQVLFRFIIEEGSLYFSRNRRRPRSLKDCICVLDSGITDLNLKVSKVKDNDRVEFKLSNNVINLRVCSDSLNALCELIVHFTIGQTAGTASPETGAAQEYGSPTSMPTEVDSSILDGDLIRDALSDVTEDDDNLSNASGSLDRHSCECPQSQRLIEESGFFILGDDDVGAGINPTAEPQVRILTEDPVKMIDNHFGTTFARPLPTILAETVERYLLEDLSLVVHLYGGKDFDSDDEQPGRSDKDIGLDKEFEHKLNFEPYTDKADTEGYRVRFAQDGNVHLWESLDLMSAQDAFSAKSGAQNATGRDKSKGGRHRKNDVCVQLYLSKIKSLFETFEPSLQMSWRFVLMINEIEIHDRVKSSRINKMLYEFCSDEMPRRNNANMLFVRAVTTKNAADNNDECELKMSMKHLRVNIDQDTLMFLIEFFSGINPPIKVHQPPPASASPVVGVPNLDRRGSTSSNLMTETQYASATGDHFYPRLDSTNSTLEPGTANSLEKTDESGPEPDRISITSTGSSSRPSTLYVKTFIFSPEVHIKLDYTGKFDMEQGALYGILKGLTQLNESQLTLKRLHNNHGLLGIDRVAQYAANEWLRDIKRYQLPKILGGVGPMHSFVQLFQGVRDLVWMPIDQYRRDKRLVRGLQRGASSFSTSSAMAVLDLANRMVCLVQNTAQFAHDVVTPPHHGRQLTYQTHHHQLPTSQPRDLREGMTMGFAVVRQGITGTVRAVSTASTGADDVSGAIGGVIRQMPSCVLSPIINLAQATSNVLLGARNQLTPEARRHDKEKYKDRQQQQQNKKDQAKHHHHD